jgi:thioredoxin-like negative regulator of GroEL
MALPSPLKNFTSQQLAHVLLAQEKVVDAEQRFRSARALAPPEVFFGLADALVAGGKLEEAGRYLDEARQQPTYFEVERGMRRATLLVARGDIDNAVVAIQASLGEAEKLTNAQCPLACPKRYDRFSRRPERTRQGTRLGRARSRRNAGDRGAARLRISK